MQKKMLVSELLEGWPIKEIIGKSAALVSHICFDSRKVDKNSMFIAVPGWKTDGHLFINSAIESGCRVIAVEKIPAEVKPGVTFIRVDNTQEFLGFIAGKWYDHPSKKLQLIGVTGTNGKTTLVTLLHQLFSSLGFKVGMLSTIENKIGATILPSSFTTPDVLELNRLLHEMVEAGCPYAFMEVSSHALVQKRIFGIDFAGAVFTNISRDHLDYHGTFEQYIKAKKILFDHLPATSFALINADDKNASVMVQNSKAKVLTYGLYSVSNYKGRILSNTLAGLELDFDGDVFNVPIYGTFNASNLLAVFGVALQLHDQRKEILIHLSGLVPPQGRLDICLSKKNTIIGVVDYAHTPDALEKLLEVLGPLREKKGKLIVVVGCGGDRDSGKRPLMGKIAVRMGNLVIFTADNPRSEDVDVIIDEMEANLNKDEKEKVLRIANRKSAIKSAVQMAVDGDIIVVAGKGHEKYQEINGEKFPFDDKIELTNALAMI